MNINFTDKLNKELQSLAISKEILNNNKLVLSFKFLDISKIANAIKDANNEKFNFEVDANFDNETGDYNYLKDFDFDYAIDYIFDDLTESNKETFVISFKPVYTNDILNLILTGNRQEIIKKLCLFACHSTKIIQKNNEHCRKLIQIDLTYGIINLSDDDILEFIKSNDKIDNHMRDVFDKYLTAYKEKLELMEKLKNDLEIILSKVH